MRRMCVTEADSVSSREQLTTEARTKHPCSEGGWTTMAIGGRHPSAMAIVGSGSNSMNVLQLRPSMHLDPQDLIESVLHGRSCFSLARVLCRIVEFLCFLV
jgi:hypothetical protein